jgi:hypothetical protein
MINLDQMFVAGTLLVVETGEYSDQRWDGPVRVLRDFTAREAAEKYITEWVAPKDEEWADLPTADGFLPWLVKERFVEAVDNVVAWHVGCYSRFEP